MKNVKNVVTILTVVTVVFLVSSSLTGCSDSDDADAGASVDVTGTWFGQFTLTLGPVAHNLIENTTRGTTATLTLTQVGNHVTGQIAFTRGPSGVVDGSVSGSTFTLNIYDDECGESAWIKFAVTGSHMSATSYSGKLCDNGPKNLVGVTAELDKS